MARPELGLKRVCQGCSAKFYDLHKDPIVCPKCGTVYEQMIAATSARGRQVVEAEDETEVVTSDAELISLEDADAEASGGKVDVALEDDIEIEDAGAEDDTFLEEEEEDSDDVSDLIGDTIDDDEES